MLDKTFRLCRIRILFAAGVAQLVERNLAKVEVASSRLVSRSILSSFLYLPSDSECVGRFLCFRKVVRTEATEGKPQFFATEIEPALR